MVGAVGVGGVLLPPALILIGGADPHAATAISLISFTATGAVSAALYARSGEFPRGLLARLAPGLLLGAFAGGLLSGRIPGPVILGALCAVSLFSAVWTAFGRRRGGAGHDRLGLASAGPLGLAVGFGSAVTGTSGPVLLTPALMAGGFAARRAIAAGQIAQILITPAGAAGYLLKTRPDLGLTATLAAATAVGSVVGISGVRRLRPPERLLRGLVVVLLFATALLVAIRLLGQG